MSIVPEPTPAPAPTIAERIEKGREAGNHFDGAIVPFPPGLKEDAILFALKGGERATVDRLRMEGFRPTYYEYRSAAGEVIQVIVRFDHLTAPKQIRPVRYCGRFDGKGHVLWMKALDGPLPLYGLDRLAARPDAPVLVVEGEKSAEAAARIFPDHVVITWPSGANNVHRVEMLAVEGKQLVLWPDNDPPGRDAMRKFAAHAYQAGAISIRMVDVPPDFGEKWDLADPVPATAEDVSLRALLDSARVVDPALIAHLASDARQRAEQHRLLGYKPGESEVEIAHADTALRLLDPCMYGNEWRRVARCIFYAFGDRGLSMFDSWSQGSQEKYRAGEPERLWVSYREERSFRGLPLAWLFRRAAYVLASRGADEAEGAPNVELDADAIVLASIEEISEDHAVVVRGGKTAVLWENYDPRFGRFTETYLKRSDFVDRHVRKVLLPADKAKGREKATRVTQGNLWFGSNRRRMYDGVHFAPGQDLGPRFLNTWRGFAVDPVDNPAGWSRLKEHLRSNVAQGDEASFAYLMNWMAFAVQRLDQPIGTALILVGPKGAGKSIVTQMLGHLFGRHTFITSRMDDVTGRFNERLETTALLGLEEAVAPQNRAADGTLKDTITRQTLRLEGKFFGVWEAPNYLRIIVTSNNEHVVRADGAERRYAVFDVTSSFQADPHARRRYFGEMVEQMETGGYAAMLGELLARDIRGWNPEHIPETRALRRQKEASLINDPVRSYLFDRLSDGINITMGNSGAGTPIYQWSETETVTVPCRDLNEDFRVYCEHNGFPFGERKLAADLARYMPDGFKAVTVRSKADDPITGTYKAYPLPPLPVARAAFEAESKLRIERED
jgi:hypothetical protein